MRRVDRWIVHHDLIVEALASADSPLAVDLGYGARPDTALELAARLRTVVAGTQLVGLEIDPGRVVPAQDGVRFAVGGFELAGLRPHLVRVFNVLRQYDETEVVAAWSRMQRGLAPGGYIVEGTCDELGRRCCWILLDNTRPLTFTLSWDPAHSGRPSDLAERLPKALIHRNVPGERIHHLLTVLDRCWDVAAPMAPFGPRQRWRRTLELLSDNGIDPLLDRRRHRDNVVTVPWDVVAPAT
ncbi:class I SAM-dependent methyltransferase [Williamsia sp. DF01-3]|uniref:class I SAM-dependent methyltransferase n=1 Tax=Williamsia sp. DF01-3 TaxID=2934157 RepID=UPI001FF5AD88|nr:class I SAM-dependent methyltransferase [Williamsia sp. DF01-3]MCK0517168.1 class I SAM-dependent methyltransferase [Williamsia sp. DF01-3]